MNSTTLYSEAVFDVDECVDDLLTQFHEKVTLQNNSAGILLCTFDMECKELIAKLQAQLPFPIIGATAMAQYNGELGISEVIASLTILTGDDVDFSVSCTGSLNADNYRQEVIDTYNKLSESKSEPVKLNIIFGDLFTIPDVAVNCMSVFQEVAPQTPYFGGLASDLFEYGQTRIFYNGEARSHSLTFLQIRGNVSPLFSYSKEMSEQVGQPFTITKCDGNIIYELNGEKPSKILSAMGYDPQTTDFNQTFMATPFSYSYKLPNGEQYTSLRIILKYDKEADAIHFLSGVKEGGTLTMGIFDEGDINKFAHATVRDLLAQDSASPHNRHTLISISCAVRFSIINQNHADMNESVGDLLPQNMNSVGMYSYGELCPYVSPADGYLHNLHHSGTLAVMLI